jgi:hypothetical protein
MDELRWILLTELDAPLLTWLFHLKPSRVVGLQLCTLQFDATSAKNHELGSLLRFRERRCVLLEGASRIMSSTSRSLIDVVQ